MIKSIQPTRREFVQAAGASLAVPYILTSTALGNSHRPPASDRIVMGGIGIGNMGQGDMGAFMGRGDVQYVALAEVRTGFRDAAKARADAHYQNQDCKAYNDFRELLARTDIDAVHVATPDHWHAIPAILACQAGKDVYVEKPISHNVFEGRQLVEAARKHKKIVQTGTQSRSNPGMRELIKHIHDGGIGNVVAAVKGLSVKDMASDVGVPYHPGAKKYYQEAKAL